MKFNERLKELRKKNGLTQEELASELNVSRQAITKWESGDGIPDVENLKNISLYFHVSVDYLLDNKAEQTIDLKNKFKIVELFMALFGVCLGFVAKSFEFGFVMCLLLPGITICIENIVLSRKYQKENNNLALKELKEENLPKDLYGKILNTNKAAKGARIKNYLISSLLEISVISLFTVVATVFGVDELDSLELTLVQNETINNLLNFAICYAIGFAVFFVIDLITNELKVYNYNKIGKK